MTLDLGIVYSLMLMVHTITGMPTPPLPIITVASKEDAKVDIPEGSDVLPGHSWKAMTDLRTGVITFREAPNLKVLDDYCALAHELTHYFQWANQVKPKSPAHLEPPAYAVQAICYEKNKDYDTARWARIQEIKYLLQNE